MNGFAPESIQSSVIKLMKLVTALFAIFNYGGVEAKELLPMLGLGISSKR